MANISVRIESEVETDFVKVEHVIRDFIAKLIEHGHPVNKVDVVAVTPAATTTTTVTPITVVANGSTPPVATPA